VGVPGQGVVVEGVQGVKYAPKQPRMYENGGKNGQFSAIIDLKIYFKVIINKIYSDILRRGFLRNT
jgi:hypothetical protein